MRSQKNDELSISEKEKKEKKYSGGGFFGDVYSMDILPNELELEDEDTHPKFELQFQLHDLSQPLTISPQLFFLTVLNYNFKGKLICFHSYLFVWLLRKWHKSKGNGAIWIIFVQKPEPF
ncbi:hypothetical protein EV1_043701 [Malus domestica]